MLLATLREARIKCNEHTHTKGVLKSECCTCRILLTIGSNRKITKHIKTLLKLADEALEDDCQSQAELLLLKAQAASINYTGRGYDDKEIIVITHKLIRLYQDRNSDSEAEVFLELLTNREKATGQVTNAAAEASLLESLKKTTPLVCGPIMKYNLSNTVLDPPIPFAFHWRALWRNVIPPVETVDLTAKDNFGNTALHDFIRRDQVATVEALVRAGADVLARNNEGQTPLELACIVGSLQIVKYLLDHQKLHEGQPISSEHRGARVSVTHTNLMAMLEPQMWRSGSSPMHAAVEHRRPEIVQCLLEYGATATKIQTTPDGETAYDLALEMAAQMSQSAVEKAKSTRVLELLDLHNNSAYLTPIGQRSFLDEEIDREATHHGEALFDGSVDTSACEQLPFDPMDIINSAKIATSKSIPSHAILNQLLHE